MVSRSRKAESSPSLPVLAQNGHGAISDLSPLCAPKRTPADHSEFMGSRPSREIGIGRYYCFTRRIAERMQNIRESADGPCRQLASQNWRGIDARRTVNLC